MFGRGLANNDNKYLKLGKYKANREKLLGGKLQIRSENENQVNNVKSQIKKTIYIILERNYILLNYLIYQAH
jgi:hypothetical protein